MKKKKKFLPTYRPTTLRVRSQKGKQTIF